MMPVSQIYCSNSRVWAQYPIYTSFSAKNHQKRLDLYNCVRKLPNRLARADDHDVLVVVTVERIQTNRGMIGVDYPEKLL